MNTSDTSHPYACVLIMPVFNEAVIIEQSLRVLLESAGMIFENIPSWKIVVVDNGSNDDTLAVARGFAEDHNTVTVLSCPRPGRGTAIKKAVETFRAASIYCYCDIDIPIDACDLARLMGPIQKGGVDIVIPRRCGSRPAVRRILTTLYRILCGALFHLAYHDVQAGVKAFSNRAAVLMLETCREDGYFLDTEFVVMAQKKGLVVHETPIAWVERRYHIRKSKISPLRDSFIALKALMRIQQRGKAWRNTARDGGRHTV